MTKLYFTIYKTTNLINGKIYIGAHGTENLNDRYIGSGKVLKRAIKKYGRDNFTKEFLSFHDTAKEMFLEEAKIITRKFIKRKDVYNKRLGGLGNPKGNVPWNKNLKWNEYFNEQEIIQLKKAHYITHKGRKKSKEEIEKNRKSNTGKKRTKEFKDAQSKRFKNIPKSKEHRKNISKSKKGLTIVKDSKTNETIGAVSINHEKVLSGEWVHINKGRKSKLRGIPTGRKGIPSGRGKKVHCIELNITFESCLAASKHVGLKCSTNIHDVCLGKQKTCGGYTWKYVNN